MFYFRFSFTSTDAGITSAGTCIINQLVRSAYLLKLPTHFWYVELHRQVKQTDMGISYRRLLKPKSAKKTVEFRFEVIVLVSLSFYLHCRFCVLVLAIEKRNMSLTKFSFSLIEKNTAAI